MNAVSRHLPPRPNSVPNAPGMFAFADPQRVSEVLSAAGWTPPRLDKLDLIWTSPLAAGWRRLWFSRPRSAPSTAGCATNRRRLSQPRSRPSAKRWRRTWTAERAPARCYVAGPYHACLSKRHPYLASLQRMSPEGPFATFRNVRARSDIGGGGDAFCSEVGSDTS